MGRKTQTTVDVRIIYKYALEFGATSIVIIHNYSGDSFITIELDKVLTQKLKIAG